MSFPEMGKAVIDANDVEYYQNKYHAKFGERWENPGTLIFDDDGGLSPKKKYHTIRSGKRDWKVGSLIHMVVGNRTPNRFQFAPTLRVTAIEKISIIWQKNVDKESAYPKTIHRVSVIFTRGEGEDAITHVEGPFYVVILESGKKKMLGGHSVLSALARNDGFAGPIEFLEWFNESYDGEIIHWTDTVRYIPEQ